MSVREDPYPLTDSDLTDYSDSDYSDSSYSDSDYSSYTEYSSSNNLSDYLENSEPSLLIDLDTEESSNTDEDVQQIEEAEVCRMKGNDYFHDAEYDNAITKYKEALVIGKGNVYNEVRCLSNISHTLNIKNKFEEALEYAFRAIDIAPEFLRAYIRCAEALMGLNEHKMAAVTLMKGEAWIRSRCRQRILVMDLQIVRTKIEIRVREEVGLYLDRHTINPKDLDLKLFRENGFQKNISSSLKVSRKDPKMVFLLIFLISLNYMFSE